ncbi:MAG TPA: glycosyltransferase, partial [Terriglobales bacterium]|nr:glycosyltransferase [Terriglobales bacterium]
DGTGSMVARAFPGVELVTAGANLGAAGRNLGLRRATTRYVALTDDDTWWTAPALRRAADLLDAHSDVAVVSGRVLVGADEHVDPACRAMAQSPLARDAAAPGPRLLGFLAGASMVRREAVLSVGGFEPRLFIGGEERLLASDLAVAGWHTIYADDVVVHHHPSGLRDASARRRLVLRNDLWFAWRRRPLGVALRATRALAGRAVRDADARRALGAALAGVGWAVATRRRVSPAVEADWRRLEHDLTDRAAASNIPPRTRQHAPPVR